MIIDTHYHNSKYIAEVLDNLKPIITVTGETRVKTIAEAIDKALEAGIENLRVDLLPAFHYLKDNFKFPDGVDYWLVTNPERWDEILNDAKNIWDGTLLGARQSIIKIALDKR